MHWVFDRLARLLAILGGVTLAVLIVLVCVSVVGRSLNGVLHSDLMQSSLPSLANGLLALGIGPINGDFEIVEAGMAFAIFAFLPICQLYGAHASVNVFTSQMPEGFTRVLRLIVEIVFAAVLILLAWQLTLGGLSKLRSGQTTLLLEFPVWWSYAASTIAMWIAAATGIFVAVEHMISVASGRPLRIAEAGADH